jgi:Uma2 family endonuclease
MATVALEPIDPLSHDWEPDYLYEVVDGRIVDKTMGAYESLLAGLIYGAIDRYDESHPLGRALIEMIFDLRPHVDRERRPDVAFVSFERWARDRRVSRARSWAVIPDLAVEVISRTNTVDEVADKLEEYFQAGVRLVWVVYPAHSKIYVYTSTTSVRILTPNDELDGGDVLPGFRRPIRDLFDKAGEPA